MVNLPITCLTCRISHSVAWLTESGTRIPLQKQWGCIANRTATRQWLWMTWETLSAWNPPYPFRSCFGYHLARYWPCAGSGLFCVLTSVQSLTSVDHCWRYVDIGQTLIAVPSSGDTDHPKINLDLTNTVSIIAATSRALCPSPCPRIVFEPVLCKDLNRNYLSILMDKLRPHPIPTQRPELQGVPSYRNSPLY